MWQVTAIFMARLFAALVRGSGAGLAGPLTGVWCGLYLPPSPQPSKQLLMSQVVEANYDGYSRQAVVWFPPWQSSGGPEVLQSQDLWYSPTDALVNNQIVGVFISDAFYGGNLLMAAALAVPGVSLYGPAAAMKVQNVFLMGFGQNYGGPVIQS
jgi:hypothetical protein